MLRSVSARATSEVLCCLQSSDNITTLLIILFLYIFHILARETSIILDVSYHCDSKE